MSSSSATETMKAFDLAGTESALILNADKSKALLIEKACTTVNDFTGASLVFGASYYIKLDSTTGVFSVDNTKNAAEKSYVASCDATGLKVNSDMISHVHKVDLTNAKSSSSKNLPVVVGDVVVLRSADTQDPATVYKTYKETGDVDTAAVASAPKGLQSLGTTTKFMDFYVKNDKVVPVFVADGSGLLTSKSIVLPEDTKYKRFGPSNVVLENGVNKASYSFMPESKGENDNKLKCEFIADGTAVSDTACGSFVYSNSEVLIGGNTEKIIFRGDSMLLTSASVLTPAKGTQKYTFSSTITVDITDASGSFFTSPLGIALIVATVAAFAGILGFVLYKTKTSRV